jgi:GT2 family glycosyltransferase
LQILTLNVGARAARGKVLVFHDNDMLVPQAYASELWARAQEGYEIINLKRFIFYLTEAHSGAIGAGERNLLAQPAEAIVQNLEAGGSVAMARDAFFAIGGYDEAFVGWGGEDNEFWQRASTRKVWPYAYLPIVHLWHAPQPEKGRQNSHARRPLLELSESPPERRIADLAQRNFGDTRSMDPQWLPEQP